MVFAEDDLETVRERVLLVVQLDLRRLDACLRDRCGRREHGERQRGCELRQLHSLAPWNRWGITFGVTSSFRSRYQRCSRILSAVSRVGGPGFALAFLLLPAGCWMAKEHRGWELSKPATAREIEGYA